MFCLFVMGVVIVSVVQRDLLLVLIQVCGSMCTQSLGNRFALTVNMSLDTGNPWM